MPAGPGFFHNFSALEQSCVGKTRIYAQSTAFVWWNGIDVSGYDKSGRFVLVMSFGARVWT